MAKTIRRNFPVQGMGCAACVARVQGTIKNLQGVQECNVSLASNTAQVDFDPKSITAADIKKAVQDAGYDLIVVDGVTTPTTKPTRKRNGCRRTISDPLRGT